MMIDENGTPVKVFVDNDAEPSEWIKGSMFSYKKSFTLEDVPVGQYTGAVADPVPGCKPGIELPLPESLTLANAWTKPALVTVR